VVEPFGLAAALQDITFVCVRCRLRTRRREVRVIIIDEEPAFRIGLRHVLETIDAYRIVGEAASATKGTPLVEALLPDLVLIDMALPDADGADATREICRRAPSTRVLVVSAYDQMQDVLDALEAGASGYALKSTPPDELIAAMHVVSRGGRYLFPALADRVSLDGKSRSAKSVLGLLSPREREIFRLAADCMLRQEIATALRSSPKTVETHLLRIRRKLGLRNAAELVRLAAELDPPTFQPARPRRRRAEHTREVRRHGPAARRGAPRSGRGTKVPP
jgi:DNA-binding NarL/FixJ family response regulator